MFNHNIMKLEVIRTTLRTVSGIMLIPHSLQTKAPAVRKELALLSEGRVVVVVVVAEVALETDGVVLKTRILKNLAEL